MYVKLTGAKPLLETQAGLSLRWILPIRGFTSQEVRQNISMLKFHVNKALSPKYPTATFQVNVFQGLLKRAGQPISASILLTQA